MSNVPWVRSVQRLAICVACAVFGMPTAQATVVLPADFATTVTESEVIVHGRVADVRSTLTGAPRAIESVVTISVIESFKGSSAGTVAFRVPNGQVGRLRRIVIGAPDFQPGDEVVVFLHARPPAMPSLFGLSQGVYRVVQSADRGAVVAPAIVAARGPAAERVVRGDPSRREMPVEAFAREIRAVIGASR